MKNKKNLIIAITSGVLAIIALVLILVFTLPSSKTISFMIDDEVYHTIKTKGNEELEFPENPTKDGYTFEGWFTDKDTFKTQFLKDSLVDQKLSEDMYVYAYFLEKKEKITITFNTAGGSEVAAVEVEEGSKLTTIPTPTKTGYTFAGWYDGENKVDAESYVISSDTVLKAHWTANSYKLTLDYNYEGKADKISDVSYDEKLTLEAPTRAGYVFDGWYDGETKVDASYEYKTAGNKTLVAHWSKADYTITLDVNGGTALESNTIDVKYLADFTLPTPTRSGYTFVGWYNGDDKVESGSYEATASLSLKAKWTVNTYNITYTLNDGTVATANKATYTVEDDDFTLTNPTKTGYDFDGWTISGSEAEPNKEFLFDTATASDVTIVANFTKHTYTITLDVNGGDALTKATIDVEYLADFTLPTPTKTGYTFDGWYNDKTKVESGSYTATADLSLKATWTATTYNITYNLDGGTLATENKATYTVEDDDFILNNPTKTNSKFLGWKIDGSENEPSTSYTFDTATASDVTIVAIWADNIIITLHHFDTTSTKSVEPNSESYELTFPTKEGFTFLGYYTEGQGKGTQYTDKLGKSLGKLTDTANFDLYAYYTHEIRFVTNNFRDIDNITLAEGLPLPSDFQNPTDFEKTFEGWSLTEGQDVLLGKDDPVTGNVLYAKWEEETKASAFTYKIANPEDPYPYILITGLVLKDLERIRMPEEIGGKRVEFSADAFKDATNLKNLYIADVYDLPRDACKGLDKLEELRIQFLRDTDNKSVGLDYLFGKKADGSINTPKSLTKVSIERGVLAPMAFKNITSITELELGCRIIGERAFEGCTSLVRINNKRDDIASLSASLEELGAYAFKGTAITSIEVNDDARVILNEKCFAGIENLNSLDLPFTGNTFDDKKPLGALFGVIENSAAALDSRTSSGNGTMQNGVLYDIPKTLKKVNITLGVINPRAFENCDLIENISTRDLQTVGDRAFRNCTGLKALNSRGDSKEAFLQSENFGEGIFEGCSFEMVIFDSILKANVLSGINSVKKLYIRNAIEISSLFGGTIPVGIEEIGILGEEIVTESIFKGCVDMTSVILDNVTEIKANAFNDCAKLERVSVNFNCIIDISAFDGTKVKEVNEKITSYGKLEYQTLLETVAADNEFAEMTAMLSEAKPKINAAVTMEDADKAMDSFFTKLTELLRNYENEIINKMQADKTTFNSNHPGHEEESEAAYHVASDKIKLARQPSKKLMDEAYLEFTAAINGLIA